MTDTEITLDYLANLNYISDFRTKEFNQLLKQVEGYILNFREKEKTNIEYQYLNLLKDILDNGIEKKDRTGTGTISVFGRQIRHKMSNGFPLLTTKKMYFKGIVTELLWFLRGDTNIKYLVDNDCHIWDGDAYKKYLDKVYTNGVTYINDVKEYDEIILDDSTDWPIVTPYSKEEFIHKIKTDDSFAKQWGELGPIYGKQWRNWEGVLAGISISNDIEWGDVDTIKKKYGIDQIINLINDLKTNPDSRRLMVNAWNVGELDQMTLPPCHYGFQVYTRELTLEERNKYYTSNYLGLDETKEELDKMRIPTRSISLMWNQRSVDTLLGLPFNIASYALLLEILGKITNMIPDELVGNLGDTHLYSNHLEQAKEQISRKPYDLPSLKILKTEEFWKVFDVSMFTHLDNIDFQIENYKSHEKISAPLSN